MRVSCRVALVAILMASAQPQAAMAESWVEIERMPNGTIVYADKDYTKAADGRLSFWHRRVLPSPGVTGIYENGKMTFESMRGTAKYVELRVLVAVDCRSKNAVESVMNFMDARGEVVSKIILDPGPPLTAPGSLSRDEQFICTAAGMDSASGSAAQ